MASCPQEDKYGYDDNRFEKVVDAHFHCSICYNVLKDPKMCRNNEHVFCRGCITEHLTVNSHTCPECNEHLTVETLRRGPRMVINYLSELKIKCDYSSRGCQKFVRLQELDTHVQNCGFAPVECSNEECGLVVNKLELVHHESSVCEFRKVKCHNCEKIEQDMDVMKQTVDEVKALMVQLSGKFRLLENAIQITSAINHSSTALLQDVFVAGGWNKDIKSNQVLNSVERFSWKNNTWESMSSMKLACVNATSFVYKNQVFVVGGRGSRIIEVSKLNEYNLEWGELEVSLPEDYDRVLSVVCQYRAILFCIFDEFDFDNPQHDCVVELSLDEPYACKKLWRLPGPIRKCYNVLAFGHKVLLFGGNDGSKLLNNVLEFDLTTSEFKDKPPLPRGVREMAVVRWGDEAVLMGGIDDDGRSNKVLMYNSKTGKTTELPSMSEERVGCCAIITGNTIVVMGGRTHNGRVRSVEAFTFGGYSWRYLPAMNDIRSAATATVLPSLS